MLYSNVVKFGRREIGKVVRYLSDKTVRLALQLSLLRGSRPKSGMTNPRQCTQSAPDFIQIGSLLAELAYIRTREHRQSALESESNIRLKPSFEPNNDAKLLVSLLLKEYSENLSAF